MTESNIKMIGPDIKAKAGEKVRLNVVFDRPCNSTIWQRRSTFGYDFVSSVNQSDKHECDAMIYDDTTNFIVSASENGKPELYMPGSDNYAQIWCNVIINEEPTPDPMPEPDEKDLGKFLFKYGILGDTHICEDNDDHSPGNTNDDWWDESDFKACMDILASDPDVKFVESVGDIIESGSPAKATPNKDYKVFYDLYNVTYWQTAGLRFFTPTGNHDFYGMYESRYGDTIMGKKFTDETSVDGYNKSVRDRIAEISISGQGINGIVPARGRIVFDTDDGKVHTSGQGDMNFFAFNAYIEMYKDAAGFSGGLTPTENRFSDEAIKTMTDYVLAHWDECRDKLSGYYNGYLGMRNAYSKLSFWMRKGNHIFVNLSLDYGDDVWEVNKVWHDRMIHARQILNLDERDPYIRRMLEYVADTDYSEADHPYNYRYYSPNALIWLKEILENNKDKCIHVFMHHPLPHRVGNDDPFNGSLPKDGGYSYATINKAGIMTAQGINSGSNTITGIEFHFLNKLGNQFKNVIFYSGHSHISFENAYHFDNHDYPFVKPDGSAFVYTKASLTPKDGTGAWFVSLPSTSKPRLVVGGSSSRMYADAEMTIVEVYNNGVKIKGYKVKKDNVYVYDKEKPLVEKSIVLQ